MTQSEMQQFDTASLAPREFHGSLERGGRHEQGGSSNVGSGFCDLFPPTGRATKRTRLVAPQLLNHFARRDDRRPGSLDNGPIAVNVVAMMVGIEEESDRLIGGRANRLDQDVRAARHIGIDQQDMVAEHYPTIVAHQPRHGPRRTRLGAVAEIMRAAAKEKYAVSDLLGRPGIIIVETCKAAGQPGIGLCAKDTGLGHGLAPC